MAVQTQFFTVQKLAEVYSIYTTVTLISQTGNRFDPETSNLK